MSRHSPRRTLAMCCATHGLHDGLSDINYVLLPILAQAFNLSLMQVGLIRSAWRAATSLFEFPAGLLAERFGVRILLSFGTACSGIAFIALGHPAGFATILLTLFCAGFGSAFQHPLCSTVVSNAYPDEGRRIGARHLQLLGRRRQICIGRRGEPPLRCRRAMAGTHHRFRRSVSGMRTRYTFAVAGNGRARPSHGRDIRR